MSIIVDYYLNKSEELANNFKTNTQPINAFFRENIELLKKLANQEKQAYRKYLKTFVTDVIEKVCVVDTFSLKASAQKLLCNVLEKNIKGYYWQNAKNILLENSSFFEEDSRTKKYFKDWNFMEWLMTAPEFPVENVLNGKPIYKKDISKCEETRCKLYPNVSTGIENFAADVYKIFADKPIMLTKDLIPYWVNLLAKEPTKIEEKEFEEIKHAIDSDHNNYIHLFPWWYEKTCTIVSANILGFIPFFKIKEWRDNIKYYFMNIPVLKVHKKNNKTKFYLFSWIYLFEK